MIFFNMHIWRIEAVSTPMSTADKLATDLSTPFTDDDTFSYCGMVGALQYLMLTPPDILIVVNKV